MRIGDYLVMDKLGRGGMGQVYSAIRFREPNFAMPCAIKLLHAELACERGRFFEEAQIAAQLDHGRIVKVIDVGEFGERPYLVMEWVDGVNLRTFVDKLREQAAPLPLGLDLVTYIVSEVLAALEYAHERTIAGLDAGIIHYDVTPGNILISSSGEIKLTDFGIARFAANAGPLSRSVGTPRYMAAEQMMGHPCRATDIYSLGVVLHELIDDRPYLEGDSPEQFRVHVLNGPPPRIARKDAPAWLDQLRRQMLQPFANDRPTAKAARSVILEHAGRTHETVESLEALYRRCVGPRRSGYTRLYHSGEGDHSLRSMLARQIGHPRREPGDELRDLDERVTLEDDEAPIEPTQRLPPPREVSSAMSTPPLAPWRPLTPALSEPIARVRVGVEPGTRWIAWFVGSASAVIVALLVLVIVLAHERSDAAPTDPGALQVESASSSTRAEPAREPQAVELVDASRLVAPMPTPLGDPTPAPRADPPDAAAAKPIKREKSSRPPAAEKSSRPPAAEKSSAPKITVALAIHGSGGKGQVRIGPRKRLDVDLFAFTELTPGSYSLAWRLRETDEWTSAGWLAVDDIGRDYYEVELFAGRNIRKREQRGTRLKQR